MALAASIAEPPPKPITQSGSNSSISATPFFTDSQHGSGSTSVFARQVQPAPSRTSVTTLSWPSSS